MTGLKDFSVLEFIVWPPSSPWEREWVRGPYSSSVIWLDWIMALFHVYLFCDRYHFSLKLLLLTVYSYAKVFSPPPPPFSPCERQFVCLPYQHLLSQVQIQKQIHKLQIQILVNRTTRIILMSSWKSFQICRPSLSSPLIANCQESRSGTQITESPNQSEKKSRNQMHFENCFTEQLKKCFLLIVTQLFSSRKNASNDWSNDWFWNLSFSLCSKDSTAKPSHSYSLRQRG